MLYKEEFKARIDAFVEEVIASLGKDQDNSYANGLVEKIHQTYAAGGKRLRPYLAFMSYLAHGGADEQKAINMAAAWEILHLSLLIQDDIIDQDLYRHGQANVSGRYYEQYQQIQAPQARHFADGGATIAGSLLMNAAKNQLQKATQNHPKQSAIHSLYDSAVFQAAQGEVADYESDFHPIEQSDPAFICHSKTSSYTTIGPLVSGAILAGAETHEKLQEYAVAIGYGFQLADDLLGTFGDEATTGKSTSADIQFGKRTQLLKTAYLRADDQARDFLNQLGRVELTEEDIQKVRDIFIETGAKKAVEDEIKAELDKALRALDEVNIDEDCKKELEAFAVSLTMRAF